MTLTIEQFTCKQPFYENAYFIMNPDTKDLALVDPGDGAAEKTHEFIKKGYNFTQIILTHVHIDHTWDLPKLREEFSEIPVIMHEGDRFWAENYQIFQNMFGLDNFGEFPAIDTLTFVNEGDKINISGEELTVIHVPGHSAGHIALYHGSAKIDFPEGNIKVEGEGEGFCVVGDVIFKKNVGRTDLHGGDGQTLMNTIKNKIFALPGETILYNGHGEETTVEFEKKHNYMVGDNADGSFIFW